MSDDSKVRTGVDAGKVSQAVLRQQAAMAGRAEQALLVLAEKRAAERIAREAAKAAHAECVAAFQLAGIRTFGHVFPDESELQGTLVDTAETTSVMDEPWGILPRAIERAATKKVLDKEILLGFLKAGNKVVEKVLVRTPKAAYMDLTPKAAPKPPEVKAPAGA